MFIFIRAGFLPFLASGCAGTLHAGKNLTKTNISKKTPKEKAGFVLERGARALNKQTNLSKSSLILIDLFGTFWRNASRLRELCKSKYFYQNIQKQIWNCLGEGQEPYKDKHFQENSQRKSWICFRKGSALRWGIVSSVILCCLHVILSEREGSFFVALRSFASAQDDCDSSVQDDDCDSFAQDDHELIHKMTMRACASWVLLEVYWVHSCLVEGML